MSTVVLSCKLAKLHHAEVSPPPPAAPVTWVEHRRADRQAGRQPGSQSHKNTSTLRARQDHNHKGARAALGQWCHNTRRLGGQQSESEWRRDPHFKLNFTPPGTRSGGVDAGRSRRREMSQCFRREGQKAAECRIGLYCTHVCS